MAEDSPYSQRQRAQSYLIQNLEKVHRATGRTAGFDDKTVTDLPLGPPAVAITRVISDNRTVTGKSLDAGSVSVADGNTFLNSTTPSRYLDIFSETVTQLEDELDNLIPDIKLFKVYPGSGESEDENFEIEFSNEWLGEGSSEFTTKLKEYNTKQKAAQDWERHFGTSGEAPKVGITGMTIKKLGGNPAEVESNIQVSITIETMNLNNLFFRHIPPRQAIPSRTAKKWRKAIDNGDLPNGIAWIDLIKMNPNTALPTNDCGRIYDEEETQIKLQVGYTTDDDDLHKAAIMQELDANSIANSKITQEWVDEMVASGRIGGPGSDDYAHWMKQVDRNESGAGTLSPTLSQEAQNVIDIINGQKETYHLVLQNHELTVDPELSVRMTVNFIGYGEVTQRTNKADLLGNPIITEKLQTLNSDIDELTQRTGALRTLADIEGMPEETEDEIAAKKNAKATNENKEACAKKLDEEIEQAIEEYDTLLLESKRTLHDQIKLAGENYDTSRIYEIVVPLADPIWSESRPGTTPKTPSPDTAPIIVNYKGGFSTGGDEREQEQLGLKEVVEGSEQMTKWVRHESDAESRKDKLSSLSTIYYGGNYRHFQFVYLGDIVEAALEVVARNNGFGPTDGSPVVFYGEMSEKGTLGPVAQKTIKRFGKYIFGDIKLPQFIGEDEPRYINIADIPIEFEQFRTFWYNKVVSRPNLKTYYLKNLINGLVNELVPYAIDNRATHTANSKDSEAVQTIATYFSLSGDPTDLNTEVKKAQIPDPEKPAAQALAALQGGLVQTAALKAHLAQHPEMPPDQVENLKKYIAVNAGLIPDPNATNITAPLPPGAQLKYAGYLGQKSMSYRINRSHEAQLSNNPASTYNIFAVTQKPSSAIIRGMGSDPQADDLRDGIPWFELSSGPKGMLVSVQFKRNDLIGLREANMMADGGINKLGILREKYDATILLKGNIAFKAGSVVYVNPDSLAVAIDPPKHLLNGGLFVGDGLAKIPPPSINEGKAVSAARTLGLGGYFTVITVSHDFGDLGSNPDWKTTLETRWLSFAHIPGFEACAIKKPKDSTELSPEDLLCATPAANVPTAADVESILSAAGARQQIADSVPASDPSRGANARANPSYATPTKNRE